jgi:hypothetical protein
LPAGDEVVGVAGIKAGSQRLGDQLNVATFLGCDVRDQIVEGSELVASAEIERLVGIVPQRRHLSEPPAQQLLNGSGGIGPRFSWFGEINKGVCPDAGSWHALHILVDEAKIFQGSGARVVPETLIQGQ